MSTGKVSKVKWTLQIADLPPEVDLTWEQGAERFFKVNRQLIENKDWKDSQIVDQKPGPKCPLTSKVFLANQEPFLIRLFPQLGISRDINEGL